MQSEPERSPEAGRSPPGRSTELATRVRSGDAAAVRQVRERIRKIIRFKGLRIPHDQLDDLEQEIVTQVWQAVNRSQFDPSGGFWGFVELVTARRCIDWLRARRSDTNLSETLRDGRSGPLKQTLSQERSRLVVSALESLGSPCRELIAQRVSEGVTYRELSESLGKSEGALRVQMYRCVQKAREALRALEEREHES